MYLKKLWGNWFGTAYDDECYGDDYYYGDDDYGVSYGPYNANAFHHYDDDDEDDEEEYAQFFEQHPDVVASGIWDDAEEWDRVAEKYDTYEKSNHEINLALTDTSYPYSSSLYRNIHKQQKKKEDDWRKEVQESLMEDTRRIYYYDNPRQEKTRQEFLSLDDFLMFCADNDIEVDDMCKSDIEFYTQCHCGLDEYALSNGRKELRVSRSYGELMYDLYGSDLFYDMDSPEYSTSQSEYDELPF